MILTKVSWLTTVVYSQSMFKAYSQSNLFLKIPLCITFFNMSYIYLTLFFLLLSLFVLHFVFSLSLVRCLFKVFDFSEVMISISFPFLWFQRDVVDSRGEYICNILNWSQGANFVLLLSKSSVIDGIFSVWCHSVNMRRMWSQSL